MASDDLSSVTDTYNSYGRDEDAGPLLGCIAPAAQIIYGRDRETLTLHNTYQRLLATNQPQFAIVHGKSGSGKTALVETLRDSVCNTSGYFVTGKYFQQNSTAECEPYSALSAAFSDLCDLIVQSDDFDQDSRRGIADTLGPDAQLLSTSISSLSTLVGELSVEFDNIEASFAKFKVACKRFLCAISSAKHPIVIFLDDIQWADEGSIELINMILQDAELKDVMLILTYRDEEADVLETALLTNVRGALDIALLDLDADTVNEFVSSILTEPRMDQTRMLSDLITRRTGGNPLHVVMLIETIVREGLLEYSGKNNSWVMDIDKIQQEIMVSESLADLLTRKIELLSENVRDTLKVASLLGYQFGGAMLTEIACVAIGEKRPCDPILITCVLRNAVKDGFIEETASGYQFVHDKLQTAFRCLIGKSEEGRLHLLIGNAFFARATEKSPSTKEKCDLYRAAMHLNSAPPGMVHDHGHQAKLAAINLDAAKYCWEVSAFNKAETMLQNGIGALNPVERWSEEHCALSCELMETLSRTQLIIGDFEACTHTTREALSHCKTAEMKTKLLLVDVEVHMAANEVNDAISAANRALKSLGIKMPRKARLQHILSKLVKVRVMLRRKTNEDILDLPFTEDQLASNAVKLLMCVCTYCLMKDEADMAMLSALFATELTLKHGLSQHSPCAFAIYGVVEVAIGNIDKAYRFGKLALAMLDRTGFRESECPTVAYTHTMLTSRKEQLVDLIVPLDRVAKSGFEHGDMVYATYCASLCYAMQVHAGANLADVEDQMLETYDTLCDLGQDGLLRWLQPILQYVINMQLDTSSWENIAVLTGDVMVEDDYLSQAKETNHSLFVLVCLLWKAKAAVEFGQFSLAASVYESCKCYNADAIQLAWNAPAYFLDQALLQYGLFEFSGQRKHLRKGRKFKRSLQRLHGTGCPNATPLLAFLVAREISLQKKNRTEAVLSAAYQRGIDCLVEARHVQFEGLLNERAGFEFAKMGLLSQAERYFRRALQIYRSEWGAIAKFNQLKRKSDHVLSRLKLSEGTADLLTGTCIAIPSER